MICFTGKGIRIKAFWRLQDCHMINRSRNMRSNYHSATQSLPPKESVPLHHFARYVWHLFPSSNFLQRPFELSSFKLLVVHTKYVFHNWSGSCHWLSQWHNQINETQRSENLESWFMNFLPITFQTFKPQCMVEWKDKDHIMSKHI